MSRLTIDPRLLKPWFKSKFKPEYKSDFKHRRRAIFLGMTIAAFSPSAIATESAKPRVQIVATTGMIGDIVANIVPDDYLVKNIIREGVDPHLFQATRSDFVDLLWADVNYYNGLHLEGKLQYSFERLKRNNRTVLAVTELANIKGDTINDEDVGTSENSEEPVTDPHIWMDPKLWRQVLTGIAEHLLNLYPQDRSVIDARYQQYAARLDALIEYSERVMASIPKEQRILVTAHDAFHYFGKAFNLRVMGLQGISTESEAGLLHVETLIDLLVEQKISAIFVESTVSQRGIEALRQGAARRGHVVEIGGKLFSDAMGPTNTYEGTYIGMIEHNVNTIARALGGSVPRGGLRQEALNVK